MRIRTFLVFGACLAACAGVWAQGRNIGPEWQVASADPQRTSWQRSDPNISVENLSRPGTAGQPDPPGFNLQWKTKLPAPLMSEAVTVNGVGLFWPVSLIAGSTNSMSLIDNDTGNVQWTREFGLSRGTPAAGCSGPIAAAARPVAMVPPAPAPPRAGGGGRGGTGYRGAVGAPGEGVPAELSQRGGGGGRGREAAPAQGQAPPGAPPQPAPQAAAPPAGLPAEATAGARAGAAPGRGGGGGLGRLPGPAYMIADDGTLRTTGWLTGKDVQRPTPFLPANARHSDPLVVDNVLYTSTSNGCGGAPNAIWAVDVSDPETKKVMSTRLDGGNPVGAVAMTTNGTVIAAVSPGRVIALDQKTLQIKNWFSARDFDPAAGPIVLQHAGKDVVAVPAKDGRVFLLDPATLGGATQDPPMYVSRSFGTISGALATWQDGTGTQWLLVPSSTSVIALKVADAGGKPSLADGWTSRALVAPVTPIIVNDVVFAASSGQPRGRAVLYAFDGKTGKELWNSGTEMTSFMPGRTMWGANSQVHVGTADGMVYQFGFLLERR